MTLEVVIRSVYGNDLVYPLCEKSKEMCRASGTKSMTPQLISIAKILGYKINVVSPTIVL